MIAERLTRARKAAGLSLRSLGGEVGLTHAAIKKYEDGQVVPSSDVLLKLARAVGVRTEYFFRPADYRLDGVEYRKRRLPAKALNAIEHRVLDHVERRLELESLFPACPTQPFEPVPGLPRRIGKPGQIEDAAEKVREAWSLGLDPIPDLVDVLETRGIRVYMLDADHHGKFDGLAARVGDQPVIVVGRDWPGDRQRFTLAHELGHLLLDGHLAEGLDEAAACNHFAGALLLPRDALLQEIGKHRNAIELRELALLKAEFGLSMQGVVYRLRDLGIIGERYAQDLFRTFMQKGWRKREPGEPYPSEQAHTFEQLVFHALAEDYIGEAKAAELLNLPLAEFKRLRAMDGRDAAAHQ